jgi:hypothetical protein
MPWEIFRSTSLTPQPRPVDFYTKSGEVEVYAAYAVVIPEYNVAATILAAGPQSYDISVLLLDNVAAKLVPTLDSLARTQAQEKYAGRYVSSNSSNDAALTLTVDDGPGLKISEWKNLGKDMLLAFETVLFQGPQTNGTLILDTRIYPSGIDNRWRVQFEKVTGQKDWTLSSTSCDTWAKVDQFRYARKPVDEVEFVVGKDGIIHGMELPGLRAALQRA